MYQNVWEFHGVRVEVCNATKAQFDFIALSIDTILNEFNSIVGAVASTETAEKLAERIRVTLNQNCSLPDAHPFPGDCRFVLPYLKTIISFNFTNEKCALDQPIVNVSDIVRAVFGETPVVAVGGTTRNISITLLTVVWWALPKRN